MPSDNKPTTFGELPPSQWPGERLGLPEKGSGSIGRIGRRILAFYLDWFIAYGAITIVFPSLSALDRGGVAIIAFAILQMVFIPTIGGSIGHRICGMRVAALNGTWVGIWRPIVRTLLLLLVIPLLVWDSDQRAFHDKIAGTVLIRS